jgi:hypothetical protein
MCVARTGGMLPSMKSKRTNLILELELDDGHLSGSAAGADGDVLSFQGWLGLIGVIDALVEGKPAPAPLPSPEEATHALG